MVISIQPLIILSFYFKKVLLTQFAMETVRAQAGASQVASEAVAQHRTVTAFSAQDKVSLSALPVSLRRFVLLGNYQTFSRRSDFCNN